MKRRVAGTRRNQRGFTLMIFAGSAVVLLGFVGISVDVGWELSQKRRIQTAADAAAVAAAQELKRGNTTTLSAAALASAAKNGFTDGTGGAQVLVTSPPDTGAYVGNNSYAQVTVSQPQPTYFMKLFHFDSVPMSARAVAGLGAGGECIYLLHPTFEGAYYSDGGTAINTNCGMVVNSNSQKAINNQGSTTMGGSIRVVGGVDNQGTLSPSPVRTTTVTDPLAYLAVPSSSGLTNRTLAGPLTGNVTLNPGFYQKGIALGAGANVTLNPGLYYLKDGGLFLTKATLSGTGVTIFLTGNQGTTPILADTGSTLNLSAPTSSSNGAIEAILFFVDRNPSYMALSWCMDIQSNGTNKLQGALYFPTCAVLWQSQSSASLGAYTIVVAQYLRVDGSGTKLTVRSDYSSLANGSPIRSTVELAE